MFLAVVSAGVMIYEKRPGDVALLGESSPLPASQPATLSFWWGSVAPRCQGAVAGDGESGGVVLARLLGALPGAP